MSPPDFIIVGAMRAGTTALAQALGEHPSVFMSDPKEPSFFALDRGALDFCGPGDQWFARQHPVDWESYSELFAGAQGAITGEASAMYLSIPGVAKNIARHRPDTKIVVILRDPVARAHSAWLYLRGHGRETVRDFSRALEAEESRRTAGYGPMWWYVGASRYQEGLAEFYDVFPSSAIHVLTTEGLRGDPQGALRSVYGFLGVSEGSTDTQALTRDVNGSGVPRAEWLARLLYPEDRLRRLASRVAPAALRTRIRQIRESSVRSPAPLSEECRARLSERLHDVPSAVAELTGVDTAPWSVSAAVPEA